MFHLSQLMYKSYYVTFVFLFCVLCNMYSVLSIYKLLTFFFFSFRLIILVMTSQGASDNIDHAFNRALANSSTQTKEAPLWNNMTKLEKSGAKGGT